ncbi:MAG: Fe-S cluster assembly protein SufD [Thermomicrobiales bacterium]|nr:Fe-S cluster assembly protein SufD [Thermomicrobiales bacterium]
MSATLTQETGFSRDAVVALSEMKNEPTWLRDARLQAWDVYESIPMPARTDEEWRRTDVRALKLGNLHPFSPNGHKEPSLESLLSGFEKGGVTDRDAQAGILVQKDAATAWAEANPALVDQGVIYCDIDTAAREHEELFKQYFMTQAVPVDFGKFEALHAALWQGGSFLYVPKGVSIEEPFRSFTTSTHPANSVFTHTLIVLEQGAEAFLVDAYGSETFEGQSLASGVVELILGKASKLRYVQMQDWGRDMWSFMTERATLASDATLNSLHVTLGSRFSKSSIGSHLQGEDALAEMLGISFADGDQFFDHHTWQLHESPYATSDLEFKTALKENARTVYSGLIKVSEGAQKTDAYQQNRNLVLSREARADSIPNLEIAANDVRCTHGATISQVVPEHIFYLQARGVPYTEAQKLIVEGFFRPVIDRIPVEEIQGFLEGAIARKVGI